MLIGQCRFRQLIIPCAYYHSDRTKSESSFFSIFKFLNNFFCDDGSTEYGDNLSSTKIRNILRQFVGESFFLSDRFKARLRRPHPQTSNFSVETDIFGRPRQTLVHKLVLILDVFAQKWFPGPSRQICTVTHRCGQTLVQLGPYFIFSLLKQAFFVKIYYFTKKRNKVRKF